MAVARTSSGLGLACASRPGVVSPGRPTDVCLSSSTFFPLLPSAFTHSPHSAHSSILPQMARILTAEDLINVQPPPSSIRPSSTHQRLPSSSSSSPHHNSNMAAPSPLESDEYTPE